ncbi:MAG: bifunctional glutamate N-acetyltransferase/amino-acid acetyltransferase ArgJ [Alphaproteobacteria bacterium]|jgi:glutamate N-acetyltransferase/amino-acid N-acetyltransferase|nr:bifunctional glutamate N-acetyltransferase/amino-acid acetyltransferase ArgJ [Alphaproteobacteria bacterium]MDP6516748.1 bifunctional glutamate N-acetyltransferase/amino-acid acetyltransferase ArgJ [Alphaproteobacteria bacterium]
MPPKSPLAPARFPDLPPIAGVRLATTACGIRYHDRTDLMLARFDVGTTVAGVLTRSTTASAPIHWCRSILGGGRARALVVNSGNANAATGRPGDDAVRHMVAAAAAAVGCRREEVFVSSTGVIGEVLDHAKVTAAMPALHDALSPGAWHDAARAIMTTDTFAKGAARSALIDGREVSINGIAKGSGMIAPNMATMLAYIVTDAGLPAPLLRKMLHRANQATFNAITVDSDTSTSDTVLLFATGAVPIEPAPTRLSDPRLRSFRAALEAVMRDLAHQIVRDGEGAEKFIAMTVTGAASKPAAVRVAKAICESPLVKTAFAGGDANWGRIVMAIGKTGARVDPDRLTIRIGDTVIVDGGRARPDYDESPVAAHMAGREIAVAVDLGVGRGRATVWTCDLTHRYIDINADYRS